MNDSQTQLEILVSLRDEVTKGFKSLSDNVEKETKKVSDSFKLTGASASQMGKLIAGAGVAIAGAAVAFGYSAVKAFNESQVAMAKVNTTLDGMVGKTQEVSTGMTKVQTKLKVTGLEAADMKNKIDQATLSIRQKTAQLSTLATMLSKHKISQSEYNLAVEQTKSQIDALNISIKAYGAKLGEADSKVVEITKSHKFTAEEIKRAREEILKASDAAVQLGFDDEDVAESVTRFYQATGNLTQAQKLNAVAMDLARAKSLDLSSAAALVNQVLSGNGRVLKQYQIDIKDTAGPLEALGQLHDQVRGQALAFSQTMPGQLEILNIKWQNIKETVGETLVTALTPFIKEFNDWLSNPETKARLDSIIASFKSWAEVVIPTLVESFKILIGWGENLYNVMVKIGNAFTSIGTGYMKVVDKVASAGDALGSFAVSKLQNLSGARASGGPVSSGGAYLVGEKGPEIFSPSSSGTILPNSSIGSSLSVQISIGNLYGTDNSAARKFANEIAGILGKQLKLRTI